jgi:peptidoglycan/LPS O-acetylase OafA/YrhL
MFAAIIAIKASCFVSAGQGCIPLPLPIERLPEFLLGMGIGVLARQGKMLKLPTWIPLAALGLLFVFLAFGAQLGIAPGVMALSNLFANEATLLLMVVTIACVAQRDIAGRRSAFNSQWLIKLGELSFTFYLVHATVMYLFVAFIGQLDVSWTNLVWYPLVLAAGLLVAFALHAWIEKPFEAKFRRLSDKIGARS